MSSKVDSKSFCEEAKTVMNVSLHYMGRNTFEKKDLRMVFIAANLQECSALVSKKERKAIENIQICVEKGPNHEECRKLMLDYQKQFCNTAEISQLTKEVLQQMEKK